MPFKRLATAFVISPVIHSQAVAGDEIVDPRPVCELLRQWSNLYPEFAYLPHKFKIAVSASKKGRAIVAAHENQDFGL